MVKELNFEPEKRKPYNIKERYHSDHRVRERMIEQAKQWHQDHKEEINARRRKRRLKDPEYREKENAKRKARKLKASGKLNDG